MYNTLPLPYDTAQVLASRLRALRKGRGWSQAELARRSGVSLGSLKRFEQRGKISLGSLLQLAHVLQRLPDFDGVFAFDEARATAEKRFAELDD